MIVKTLRDVVKHTGNIVDGLKITGTSKSTKIEGIDENKTVIIKGEINSPIKDFEGETAIGHLGVLKGYLDVPNFYADNAKVNVKHEERGNTKGPVELEFVDERGQTGLFRFMDVSLLQKQPEFKGTKWNVEIVPEKSKINDFQQFSSILAKHEEYFMPKTKDGNLVFNIGDEKGSQHRSSVIFAENIEGELKNEQMWPINTVLSILKLEDPSKIAMKFADAGALQIDIQNDIARYQYILPAHRR